MWKPYLNVIKSSLPNALNILDRCHIVKKLNEAVDEVRKEELKKIEVVPFTLPVNFEFY